MTKLPHILVVEDDREISALVARYLRSNDCRVTVAGNGRDVDRVMNGSRIDLIVLDLMLPGEDGLSLCKRLRTHSQVPIIMLTAKGDEVDRILGLEMGADDYLSKPFNPRELLARVRAVLRRSTITALNPATSSAHVLSFLGWQIHRVLRELRNPAGARVTLTDAEFGLLQVFCERPGRVLSRDQLLDYAWPYGVALTPNTVEAYIHLLREKLGAEAAAHVETVRGVGYRLREA